jgi:branched-chain amino acid transport system permease protein
MGIDINKVISLTFVIGAALGAVAGVMVGSYYGIAHYQMGFILGLKAFSAAVLGGIGNIAGADAGRIAARADRGAGRRLRGATSPTSATCRAGRPRSAQRCEQDANLTLFGSNYQDVFAFLVLIAVLIFRPSGLLGERVSDRA